MSQNVPERVMLEHAPPNRLYPTERTRGTVPMVAPDVGYATQLPEAGYPDHSEAALQYAEGMRQGARTLESRTALTTGGLEDYDDDALMAPPGSGPAQLPIIVTGPPPAAGPYRRRF